jgi:hypothetical protein
MEDAFREAKCFGPSHTGRSCRTAAFRQRVRWRQFPLRVVSGHSRLPLIFMSRLATPAPPKRPSYQHSCRAISKNLVLRLLTSSPNGFCGAVFPSPVPWRHIPWLVPDANCGLSTNSPPRGFSLLLQTNPLLRSLHVHSFKGPS